MPRPMGNSFRPIVTMGVTGAGGSFGSGKLGTRKKKKQERKV